MASSMNHFNRLLISHPHLFLKVSEALVVLHSSIKCWIPSPMLVDLYHLEPDVVPLVLLAQLPYLQLSPFLAYKHDSLLGLGKP